MTEKRCSTALPWAETPKTSSGEMPPNQFTADEYFRVPVPRSAIVTWIERTYRRRRQAALGRLPPIEYETAMTLTATRRS